jgi:chromosomal replication initiation ATPase DnaA
VVTTIAEIQRIVAEHHNMTVERMLQKDQSREYSTPRQIAMYLVRHILFASYPKIGREFRRDHSTVVTRVRYIRKCVRRDPDMAMLVIKLHRRVQGVPEPLELAR